MSLFKEFNEPFVAHPVSQSHAACYITSSQFGNTGTTTNLIQISKGFTFIIQRCIALCQIQVKFGHTNQRATGSCVLAGTIGTKVDIGINELLRQITGPRAVTGITCIISVCIGIFQVNPQRIAIINLRAVLSAVKYNPCIETGFTLSVHLDNVILHIFTVQIIGCQSRALSAFIETGIPFFLRIEIGVLCRQLTVLSIEMLYRIQRRCHSCPTSYINTVTSLHHFVRQTTVRTFSTILGIQFNTLCPNQFLVIIAFVGSNHILEHAYTFFELTVFLSVFFTSRDERKSYSVTVSFLVCRFNVKELITGFLGSSQGFLTSSKGTCPFLAVVAGTYQFVTITVCLIILILPFRIGERTVPQRRSGIQ